MLIGRGWAIIEWIEEMIEAVDYIEDNLINNIGVREVAKTAYCYEFCFQWLF